jgi:hypothetical protein
MLKISTIKVVDAKDLSHAARVALYERIGDFSGPYVDWGMTKFLEAIKNDTLPDFVADYGLDRYTVCHYFWSNGITEDILIKYWW